MLIHRADYGDFNNNGVLNININIITTCSIITNCQIKSLCAGSTNCALTMDNNLLPSHYCSDTSKEIYTEHTCVDTFTSTRTTGKICSLRARDFYEVIVDEGEARINYHFIEIESD